MMIMSSCDFAFSRAVMILHRASVQNDACKRRVIVSLVHCTRVGWALYHARFMHSILVSGCAFPFDADAFVFGVGVGFGVCAVDCGADGGDAIIVGSGSAIGSDSHSSCTGSGFGIECSHFAAAARDRRLVPPQSLHSSRSPPRIGRLIDGGAMSVWCGDWHH